MREGAAAAGLKKLGKFFIRQVALAKDGPECSSIQFPVVWDNRLGKRVVTTQDNMTAMLASDSDPTFSKAQTASRPETCGNLLIPPEGEHRNAPLAPADNPL